MANTIGLFIACLPTALILYFLGRGLVRHMREENTPGANPWEVRDPEHYGVPADIYATGGKKKH